MKTDKFYRFCDSVIKNYITEILEEDKAINCLTYNEHRLNNVYVYYEKKRVELRRKYMNDSSKPLDRHKVASCMMYAILKARVFRVNRLVKNIPEKLLLSNEYLAFYVAINIVEMFKRAEKDDVFGEKYVLYFPKAYHIHAEYEEGTFVYNTCKSLFFIKKIKYLDVFAYATILFLLEKYTDTIMIHDKEVKRDEERTPQ